LPREDWHRKGLGTTLDGGPPLKTAPEEVSMGVGTSIFLIAVGAILDFAVTVTTPGFNLHIIGQILMVVGILGLALSLMFWSTWGGFHRRTVYEGSDMAPARRRRVIEEEIN